MTCLLEVVLRRVTLLIFLPLIAAAQEQATRAAQIEADRQAKAATIQPEKTNPIVGVAGNVAGKVFRIWNFEQTGINGYSLRLGGLPAGSGLALGPAYTFKLGERDAPDLIWDSFAVGSLQGYYRLQTGVELPRLLDGRAFVSATGERFDYPRLAYYGEGQESRQSGHSDYRMQDNSLSLRGGFRPWQHFSVGALGSFQHIDIRRGTDPGIAQAFSTYGLSPAAGAEYLSAGFFAAYDDRDLRGDPHGGSLLSAEFQSINPVDGSIGGFNRYSLDAQHYFHYWNKRRVIATRVKSVMTTPHGGAPVPFYLEPTLGGQDDLRGFRPYRFYDRNSILATAEYRWTAMENLDVALFADAGKVYHNADTFSLSRVQTDIGFGLRGKVGGAVPIRVDVAFSREGAQVWFTFYNVF